MAFSFGGQSSSAQGGFGFGQSTGGLFGNTGGGLFGASSASSAPAFGSTSTSFNLFGSQASQSTSLFGSTPSSQPSLFGSSSASFNFASTGGLFGGSQAASSPSLFGSQPAFGFGAQTPQSNSAFGTQSAFGQANNQIVPAGFQAGQPDLSALRELEAIHACYDPNNPKYRFNYLFLNVVDNPTARMKPQDVDEIQWRGALHRAGGLNNPDRLWPVQAKGFKDLLARKDAQDQAIKEYSQRLEAAEQSANHLAHRQSSHLKERINMVRRKHMELSHKLLKITRHIDALEGRLAMAQEYWNPKSAETVQKLSQLLRSLEQSMAYYSADGLQKKVDALSAAAKIKESSAIVQGEDFSLDEANLRKIFEIVSQQAGAIESLQDTLKRNNRDLSIALKHEDS